MDKSRISESEVKKHYKKNYQYDGTNQMRNGNFLEKFWFKDRINAICKDIRKHRASNGEKKSRILDVGCGTGAITEGMSRNFKDSEIHAIDISDWSIRMCKKYYPKSKVRYKVGDAFKLPYKDDYFDCVISTEVIEHVLESDKIIEEIRRVLKKNGLMILNVPFKYHPIWNMEWIRGLISIDYKREHVKGGRHYEPFHKSYNTKGLIRLVKGFRFVRRRFTGLWITLHVSFIKR